MKAFLIWIVSFFVFVNVVAEAPHSQPKIELETKVLEVNPQEISKRLAKLGARKTEDTLLSVDWLRFPETTSEQQKWYLRVRSYGDDKVEVTWKGKSKVHGVSRSHQEINLLVDDHEQAKLLFEAIGLVVYAHQEKTRLSWDLEDMHFDLDTYPGVPPYLEIEAESDQAIQKMIQDLGLSSHKTSSEGERVLIEDEYGLNWYDMRFSY